MRNISLLLLAFSAVISTDLAAKNLGTIGSVWSVKEKNMISYLEDRAKSQDVDELKRKMQESARTAMNEPTSLALPVTIKTTHKEYVPISIARQDVVDAQGRIIVAGGTSINALSHMPYFNTKLIFIDGTKEAQYQWAIRGLSSYSNAKVILTGGKVNDCETLLNRVCYFDQKGKISQKIGVTHVPAFVQKKDLVLDIAEIAIDGDGHEI